jgi:DNA-binding transcriptional ArsR family regulator
MVTKFNLNSVTASELLRCILSGVQTPKEISIQLNLGQNTLSERIKVLKFAGIVDEKKTGRTRAYSINYKNYLVYGLSAVYGHSNNFAKTLLKNNPAAVEVFSVFLQEYANNKIYKVHTSFLLDALYKKDGGNPPTKDPTLEDYIKYFVSWVKLNDELIDQYPHSDKYAQLYTVVFDYMKEPQMKDLELTKKTKEALTKLGFNTK